MFIISKKKKNSCTAKSILVFDQATRHYGFATLTYTISHHSSKLAFDSVQKLHESFLIVRNEVISVPVFRERLSNFVKIRLV